MTVSDSKVLVLLSWGNCAVLLIRAQQTV